MSVETPTYEVLRREGHFELRRYAGYLTASVRVHAPGYVEATNMGFEPLADFIFGNNEARSRIAMTAPVTAGHTPTGRTGEKIAMTVPVTAARDVSCDDGEYVVSFTMPSEYSIDTLPVPNNARVVVEAVTGYTAAVVRFGGYMNDTRAEEHLRELEQWIVGQGLTPTGEPVSAQYDAPWKPGFARRNEIIVPVADVAS